MKVQQHLLTTLLYWCLVQSYPVGAASEEEELICPDSNPLNCYPKLFQPTNQWQPVREGQIIPVGLEVRLDLENMNREAKLSTQNNNKNPNSYKDIKKNHELIVSNGDPDFLNSLLFIKDFVDLYSGGSEIPKFSTIIQHLDTLIDWSSDRESGVIIARNILPFIKLSGLYNKKGVTHSKFGLKEAQYLEAQEMVYRILSSSFRNNIDAQEVLLDFLNEPDIFLLQLVRGDEYNSELITKRKLGLLGSLLNNDVFKEYFDKGGIESELIILYSKVETDGLKFRIMNLLDDMKLVKRDDTIDDDSVRDNNLPLDAKFAQITQNNLIRKNLKGDLQSREILESLGRIKKMKRNGFKVTNEFLNWLDQQINLQRDNVLTLRKRDADDNNLNMLNSEENYLEKLIELRHQVFGNSLGTRKEYIDEL